MGIIDFILSLFFGNQLFPLISPRLLMGIIDFILSLFFGGKKKEEIKKLDKAIVKKNEEVKVLEKEVVKLQEEKKVNKKEVANLKRKVTNTKKQIKAAQEVSDIQDVDEALKYLKKFSKK